MICYGRPNKTAWLEILKKQTPIIKRITEPKISYIILWKYLSHFERYILVQVKKIPKWFEAYFGLCNFFDNGCLFFQNFLSCGFIGTPCSFVDLYFLYWNSFLYNWFLNCIYIRIIWRMPQILEKLKTSEENVGNIISMYGDWNWQDMW